MNEDEIQVEVEVNQQSVLRHQLTSESDTLNNVRVPSLERDEDIEKVVTQTIFNIFGFE